MSRTATSPVYTFDCWKCARVEKRITKTDPEGANYCGPAADGQTTHYWEDDIHLGCHYYQPLDGSPVKVYTTPREAEDMTKVEAKRKEVNISMAELSRQSGVPYRTIQDWCLGAKPATNAYRIRAVARILGCSIEDLLEDVEPGK